MEDKQVVESKEEQSEHITEAEIAIARKMNRRQVELQNHLEYCHFRKLGNKPNKKTKAFKIDDEGKIVEHEGYASPVSQGNPFSGNLRNLPCSCGSGKKYKKCCLTRNTIHKESI